MFAIYNWYRTDLVYNKFFFKIALNTNFVMSKKISHPGQYQNSEAK